MTKDDLFIAFSDTKNDYLLAAAASMQTRPLPSYRPRLRYAIIAASFVLLVAMIPIIILLANRTTPPPNPPQPSTHLSITDIPGAVSINTTALLEKGQSTAGKFNYQKLRTYAYENCANFLGTAISIESVMLHFPSTFNENRYLHLTVFEIQVTESIHNAEDLDTVKVIYPCIYYSSATGTGYHPDIRYFTNDFGICAKNEPYAFYIINEAEEVQSNWNMELPVNLSDYADYFLVMHASYSEKNGGRYVSHPDLFDNWNIETFRQGIFVP